jgi:hypothetical protein
MEVKDLARTRPEDVSLSSVGMIVLCSCTQRE